MHPRSARNRSAATKRLRELGPRAYVAVREAARSSASPEVGWRAGGLRAVTPVPRLGLTGDRFRAVRAVEVLDRAGTPEARRLLTEWVGRMADPALAAEVVFALNRSQAVEGD